MIETHYLQLLNAARYHGDDKSDRTGIGTRSLFGERLHCDLQNGFPLLTTKYVNFHAIRAELLWFLSGSTNTHDLDAKIWDNWADENGDLGPTYGEQWRSWPLYHCEWDAIEPCDQIRTVQAMLRNYPDSRRHVVSAWNVSELHNMRLAPCHVLFQFNSRVVQNQRYLDIQVYQRSADLFLGAPFNLASYALLCQMMAQATGHKPGDLVWVGGDCHVYYNQFDQVDKQLDRIPGRPPTLWLSPDINDIDQFLAKDIEVLDYCPQPAIRAPIAV